jgi:heat shock protein HtpX
MSTLYSTQSSNIWKTWFLMSIFLVVILMLGWFLSLYYDSYAILVGAFLFSMIMNFVSYWFSDKIVLSISGAKEASKQEFYELYTLVENLSITTGLPMPKIYVIPDEAPNAFATGRNEEHATLAFTVGLLRILNKAELEGVIAHELAHVKNKDILLQSVVVVLVGFVTLLSDFFVRSTFFGGSRDNDNGKAGAIFMVIGIVLLILSPIIATLIQLAISRKREFLADATGALMTRYPEGLASALQKISSNARPLAKANHATAHLFISDPFKEIDDRGKEKMGFFHKLFLTHPPVEERVNALLGKK